MNAFWGFGMKKIKGGDLSSALPPASLSEMVRIPGRRLFVVQAEIVNFFAWGQVDPRVVFQQFLKAGRPSFLGP